MDLELSDDQQALQDAIRALCEGRFEIDAVRAMIDGGLDRGRWRELAETGLFALLLSEEDGGVGLGWADAVVVFEQLGASLVPGPLTATFLAAGLVEGAASGEKVVGAIERSAPPLFFEHAGGVDQLVVADDEGLWSIPASDLAATIVPRPLDPLTPVGRLGDELPQGTRIAGAEAVGPWRRGGAVLNAALQLGLAQGATDLAVGYAMERQQFGKPIGQFQAVKHICADMTSRVEVARAAVYSAGVILDDPDVGDPDKAASVASILGSQAGDRCGKDCVQIHGGMGYTWEVDAHLFMKRSWVLDHSYGTPDDHAEALAARF